MEDQDEEEEEDDKKIKNNNNKKVVELAFPKLLEVEEDEYISKGKGAEGGGLLQRFSASMDEVTDWFKQYQVDTIELWISGVIETGGVTRLVVSAKGEGGLRVILKPKGQDQG
jgi:hypothetical protein